LTSDLSTLCAGINLQADQWEALVSATADIDAELQALGASASAKPQATTKGTQLVPSAFIMQDIEISHNNSFLEEQG